MIVIRIKVLNWMRLNGIALFPFIFLRTDMTPKHERLVLRHERIHIVQQAECLIVPFYILYGFMYLYGLFKYGSYNQAYHSVLFEQEAFSNQQFLNYLDLRKLFSWVNY